MEDKFDFAYKPQEMENVSAISDTRENMILKSLWEISVFARQTVSHLTQLIYRLIFTYQPQEANTITDLFINILDRLPYWNPYFELKEVTKSICVRCKNATEYPVQRSYGLFINASSLRETNALLKNSTFEEILKVIRIGLKMPCKREGCKMRSYVQPMILKLPTVFTIAFEWQQDETETEILDTTCVLKTDIDISAIYQYEGDTDSAKYRLVSMVCSHEDRYNCVAYENNKWVRHFGCEKEVIGEWNDVLIMFRKLYIRPEILFFENAIQRDMRVSVGEQNATCVAALDMILKGANGVPRLYLKILERLPRWNSQFQIEDKARKICNRCKMDTAYSNGDTHCIMINASSLRNFKSAYKDYTFEKLLKAIRISAKKLCAKEGCEKRNYVETMTKKLPYAFTIALEWENNETKEEIFETASVLATEIDISDIYQYEGDSGFTKYCLVSMVCSDRVVCKCNCVAYERNRWVRHYCSGIEVIGDWNDVLSNFRELRIRPEILFFENVIKEDQSVSEPKPQGELIKAFPMA